MSHRRMMMIQTQEEEKVKEWKLLYDSGETTEEITSTADIDISGNDELVVIAKAVPTATNSEVRNGQLVITDQGGNRCKLVLGNKLLSNSGNPRLSVAAIRKVLDFAYAETATSYNAADVFDGKNAVDNLTTMQNSVAKLNNAFAKIRITNLNDVTAYKFGIGSRFVIFGR